MQFTTFITFLALLTSTAFAGALNRRQFDSGVASSDVSSQVNKGGNNGQANANKGVVKGHYTVSQAATSCGNAQLNCCNYIEQNDESGTGLIGAVLNVAGPIAVGCSPVSLRRYSLFSVLSHIFSLIISPMTSRCINGRCLQKGDSLLYGPQQANSGKYLFTCLSHAHN